MYSSPKHRSWQVQIEFFDGTTIDATGDKDALERWRRLATWSDPTADTHPVAWMGRVLDRARVFYGAKLTNIRPDDNATIILDALYAEGALILRRKG